MSSKNNIGTISSFNPSDATAVVDLGDKTSDVLPVLMVATKFKRHYIPLSSGDQVSIINDNAVIGSLFCDDVATPDGADANTEIVEYGDGGRIVYSGKKLTITGIDVEITGNLKVNGTITDSVGLLTDHTHTGVTAGDSKTGGR